jgi:hypothetical protein
VADPPVEDIAARDRRVLLELLVDAEREKTDLQAIIDEMEKDRARQRWRQLADKTAKAARDAQIWLPLTMAAIDLLGPKNKAAPYDRKRQQRDYEKLRDWCEKGKILFRRRGALIDVEMNSARAFAATKPDRS